MTKNEAVNKLISVAEKEVGYLEKKSNSNLYDTTANAGTANYTKYWAEIKPAYQGQPWCACFVTWCFVKAFSRDNAEALLKHYPYVYCPTMASLFTLNANPKRGDIVIFKRNGTFTHTGIVTSVDGDYFTTIEGNTSGGSSVIANGGAVCRKGYYNSKLPGTKFCTPEYECIEEGFNMNQYEELKGLISQLCERLDKLSKSDMVYDYIDDNMPQWAHEGVRYCLEHDFISGVGDGRLGLDNKDLKWCTIIMRMFKKLNG